MARSMLSPRWAARTSVFDCGGSTPARCQIHDGIVRQTECGERRASDAGRAGGALAVAGDEVTPGPEGLHARDLLLDDRACERVEHLVGAREPQAGVTVGGIGDQRMPGRIEALGIVVGTAEPGTRSRASPAPGPQAVARTSPEEARSAIVAMPEGAQSAPDDAAVDDGRGVVPPATQHPHGPQQVERMLRSVHDLVRSARGLGRIGIRCHRHAPTLRRASDRAMGARVRSGRARGCRVRSG